MKESVLNSYPRIAVWGIGTSGLGAAIALKKLGKSLYVINQGDKSDWGRKLGKEFPQERLLSESEALDKDFDLVIKSPGISRESNLLKHFEAQNIPIWSDIELASQFIDPSKIIAITGTNGKTTLTTMISDYLKQVGLNVFTGGNIGTSVCEAIDMSKTYDYFVLEISSFQLEDIHSFKPHIAILLNLSLNHGERYLGLEDYFEAKINIAKNQTLDDFLLIHQNLMEKAKKHAINGTNHFFDPRKMALEIEKKFDFSKSPLVGIHNKLNFALLDEVLGRLKVSKDHLQNFINSFKGVHFRIEYLGSSKRIKFYNDAKSTNIEATLAAITSFESDNLILIMGGKLRGRNDSIKDYLKIFLNNVKKVFVFGEAASILEKDFHGAIDCEKFENLEQAFSAAIFQMNEGILLFSPGYPSFDQYQNYVKRGEHFNLLVSQQGEK